MVFLIFPSGIHPGRFAVGTPLPTRPTGIILPTMCKRRFWRGLLLLLGLCYGPHSELNGQSPAPQTINSWTNPTSGSWEELHWSLGVLPAVGQSIAITNAGWKAVAIGPGTAQNFPQSLRPTAITLAAPIDSSNLLLLNYAGFETPLSVQELIINSNAGLTALGSALQVTGSPFSVGGIFSQGAAAVVGATNLNIGDVGSGAYELTNGTLLVSGTETIGGNYSGQFYQFGGTNFAGTVELPQGGEYNLYDGALNTTGIYYRSPNGVAGRFVQRGGTVKPDRLYVTQGTYTLAGGNLGAAAIQLPGVVSGFDVAGLGNFEQSGGTNSSGSITIGNYRPPFANASAFGTYALSNGVLIATDISIGPYGSFVQQGGTQSLIGLAMSGADVYFGAPGYASFSLSGGILSAGGISMSVASFTQSGGTNQISGFLSLGTSGYFGSSYRLDSGTLAASNTTVTCSIYSGSGFAQNGGMHTVSNQLTISQNFSTGNVVAQSIGYSLSGGTLFSPNIRVENGATFHHLGGTLINTTSVILANGRWEANANDQSVGVLGLQTTNGNLSILQLPLSNAVVRFANSSSATWESGARLIITHWSGSPAGGGHHQVYFGTDSDGLSAGQQAQIFFQNPAGVDGLYPAMLLQTGEIVPSQLLLAQRATGGLALSWAGGVVLQSATNVFGPFEDVPELTSPCMIQFNDPQRFLRLKIQLSP